ncbi:MAG: ATP-binding cassette domain-containing protein, partial [Janthinobacterium lividum]
MPASAPVLQVSGFSLRFSKSDAGPALVDDVSFSVRRGETLCIVGESGCGKSVTSLAIMGLLPRPAARITGGQALFNGVDLFALGQRELADLRGNR